MGFGLQANDQSQTTSQSSAEAASSIGGVLFAPGSNTTQLPDFFWGDDMSQSGDFTPADYAPVATMDFNVGNAVIPTSAETKKLAIIAFMVLIGLVAIYKIK